MSAVVSQLPALAQVMPHQGSMILLRRVLSHDADGGTRCEVDLEAQHWLRSGDASIPCWVALEYMAQCIAAHEGYRAWLAGRTLEVGLFVGARRVKFHRPRLPARGLLEVRARYVRGRVGLGALSYACEIWGEERSLWAAGSLNVALLRCATADEPGRS